MRRSLWNPNGVSVLLYEPLVAAPALYAAIGFDALAFAHTLSGLAATARDARNEATSWVRYVS